MRTQTLLTTTFLVLAMPLAACATNGPDYRAPGYGASGYAVDASYDANYGAAQARQDDGLLSEPPADARAGQCFAKVVVPGQRVLGPPSAPHLRWVQSPAGPGMPGPIWCQVWEPGYQPVSMTPERYGWIRVICDKDATREKIQHIQHRLHDWGYYRGGYDGQYGQDTADAVVQFQQSQHIEHGGYLSFKTMEALDTSAPPPPPVAPPVNYAQSYSSYSYQQTYAPPPAPVYAPPPAPIYAPAPQPIYAPAPAPIYVQQPPVYAQQPTYAPCPVACPTQGYQPPVLQSPCGTPSPCGQQPGYGYGAQGGYSGSRSYSVQRQLNWAGKVGW